MKEKERALLRGAVKMMRSRPSFIRKGDVRGTEHIGPDDVWRPDTRGVEPEAKILRRKLEKQFGRRRRDGGPVAADPAKFLKLRHAVAQRAFSTRRRLSPSEKVAAIQFVARQQLGVDVSATEVKRQLGRECTAHVVARWLLARHYGVAPRRLRIPRKP